jgi:hypothetical protein
MKESFLPRTPYKESVREILVFMDRKLIFQVTLLKGIVAFYFLYIVLGSFFGEYNIFHDNADFGFWTFVSFMMFSTVILVADFGVVYFANKNFQKRKRKLFVLIIQVILCSIVYFGLSYMFKIAGELNADLFQK